MKVTVSLVGVPAGEVTVAVNVTGLPNLDGLAEEARPVLVAALAMLKLCETPALAGYAEVRTSACPAHAEAVQGFM